MLFLIDMSMYLVPKFPFLWYSKFISSMPLVYQESHLLLPMSLCMFLLQAIPNKVGDQAQQIWLLSSGVTLECSSDPFLVCTYISTHYVCFFLLLPAVHKGLSRLP
jgi:hypothetical protein